MSFALRCAAIQAVNLPRPCSKPSSKPNLKTEVVVARSQLPRRCLLILRNEKQPVRNAILERQYLIGIRSDVGRISNRKVLVDSSCRASVAPPASIRCATNYRIDLKTAQPKSLLVARCAGALISASVSRLVAVPKPD